MNDKRNYEIELALSAFSFQSLQELFFILNVLNDKNIDVDEFKEFFVEKQKQNEQNIKQQNEDYVKFHLKWKRKAEKCPDCNESMGLYRVNTGPRDNVGDNYKSQWFCTKCGADILSEIPYEQLYKKIMSN